MFHGCVTAITLYSGTRPYDCFTEYLNVATFGVTMIFEWDEAKNNANIRKHGFHFAEAEEMFRGTLLVRPDIAEDYG
jgi:hypothetical protein